MLRAYNNANNTKLDADQMWEHMKSINEDDKVTKLNHYIWQRYASSVWDDVRGDNVLEYKKGSEEEDEKHVTPTQLDVMDRLIDLYSNEGETVFTPFMGIGTEVYASVSMGRKAIGVELKDSYFNQAIMNLKNVKNRFKKVEQTSLF
jgi:DNA modification methylase